MGSLRRGVEIMTTDTTRSPHKPLRVWLVEDNALYRRTIAALLDEQSGIRCTLAAGSCEEAVDALEKGARPDVVLLDIGLPGLDGIAAIPMIRQAAPDCRILMLTSHEEDSEVFRAICAGASGYLLKPSSAEQIVQAVWDLVNGGAPINAYIARKLLEEFSAGAAAETSDYGLTPREREILGLLVDGMTVKGIARELDVSPHTIDTHIRHIYEKLHVSSRSGAVALAVRERLI